MWMWSQATKQVVLANKTKTKFDQIKDPNWVALMLQSLMTESYISSIQSAIFALPNDQTV